MRPFPKHVIGAWQVSRWDTGAASCSEKSVLTDVRSGSTRRSNKAGDQDSHLATGLRHCVRKRT